MKRRNYNKKEQDQLQKIRQENTKLKKQVAKLRKVINNIDIEHYKFVQDLLNSETFKKKSAPAIQEELEKKWACHQCEEGVMRLIILHRAGEPYYTRKCDSCSNKTKMKRYTEGVEGA